MNSIYFYVIDNNINTVDGLVKFDNLKLDNYVHSYTRLDYAIKNSFLNLHTNNIDDIKYYISCGNSLRLPPDYSSGDKDKNRYFRYTNALKNTIELNRDDIIKLTTIQYQKLSNDAMYVYFENKKHNITFDVCLKNGMIHYLRDYKHPANDISLNSRSIDIFKISILSVELLVIVGLVVFNTYTFD